MSDLERYPNRRLTWIFAEDGDWETSVDGRTLHLEMRDEAPWWRLSSGDEELLLDDKPALWRLQGLGTKALVIYCHPRPESFTAAVRDIVVKRLESAEAEFRVVDLYADGFNPIMSAGEHETYLDFPGNVAPLPDQIDALLWCNTLIFVYPTWWYGLPAMLKGWLDRALLPEIAFLMPDASNKTIRPGLPHINRLGVFTTCGASRWLTFLVGAPGKRTLLRGIGFLCAPRCKKAFAAHYLMDSSTDESRKAHLDRVSRTMDRLLS